MTAKRKRVRVTEQVPIKLYKKLLRLTLEAMKTSKPRQPRRTRT